MKSNWKFIEIIRFPVPYKEDLFFKYTGGYKAGLFLNEQTGEFKLFAQPAVEQLGTKKIVKMLNKQ